VRAVVQRVNWARVSVDGETTGEIGAGLLVFIGAGPKDDGAAARHLAERVATLRIFPDEAGKMNLDLLDGGGEALVVSQFTLYADTSRGHRPSFIGAGPPALAEARCAEFVAALRAQGVKTATGLFGARMKVALENDGPVTIALSHGEGPWQADAG